MLDADTMAATKDQLVTQLRNDLNGVASRKLEPHEANGIVSSLWIASSFDKDLCVDAILSLGGKHPSEKIKDFRRYGLSFLEKLSASKTSVAVEKPTTDTRKTEEPIEALENEREETPESAAKLLESAFFLQTELGNKDARTVALEMLSTFYDASGRSDTILHEVIDAMEYQETKRYYREAAALISKPRQNSKPDSSIFFILIIFALLIIIGLMLAS